MLFSVIAFNQLKSSNSRQGGSLDGIVSFFEPFLNNQVKWSVCINNDFISSLTRKWPLPLGAVCWQCSMTWSPEPLWHSSSLALVTRWDANYRGFIASSMISSTFFADIRDSRDSNCRWCLEFSDGPWLWDVDDLQNHDCGFIFRCWFPPPGFEGTDRQRSNWGY